MNDMELIAWFPHQTKKTEQQIKRKWKQDRIYGKSEWLPAQTLPQVLEYLTQLESNQAHLCDPFEAVLTRRRL